MDTQEKLTEQQIREAAHGQGIIFRTDEFRNLAEQGWNADDIIDDGYRRALREFNEGERTVSPDRDDYEEDVNQTPWEVTISETGIWDGPNVDGAGRIESGEWKDGLEDVIQLWKEGKGEIEIV